MLLANLRTARPDPVRPTSRTLPRLVVGFGLGVVGGWLYGLLRAHPAGQPADQAGSPPAPLLPAPVLAAPPAAAPDEPIDLREPAPAVVPAPSQPAP